MKVKSKNTLKGILNHCYETFIKSEYMMLKKAKARLQT